MRVKLKIYDPALHKYLKPEEIRIDGDGEIYFNNSRSRKMPIWEPLNETVWLELRSVIIEA